MLEVQLKYVDGEHAIRGINRISTLVAGLTVVIVTYLIFSVDWAFPFSVRRRVLSTTRRLVKTSWGVNFSVAFGKAGKRNFIHEQNRKSTRGHSVRSGNHA